MNRNGITMVKCKGTDLIKMTRSLRGLQVNNLYDLGATFAMNGSVSSPIGHVAPSSHSHTQYHDLTVELVGDKNEGLWVIALICHDQCLSHTRVMKARRCQHPFGGNAITS